MKFGAHDSFALAQAFIYAFPAIQRDFVAISSNYRIINFIESQSTGVDQVVSTSVFRHYSRVANFEIKALDDYCSTMNIPTEENIITSCNYTELWAFTKVNQTMNYMVRAITAVVAMAPNSM